MSNKMWEGTVEHAKTCVLNGKLHVYYADEKQNIGVIFNNIFQLMGLIADGQYMSVDLLSDSEKVGLPCPAPFLTGKPPASCGFLLTQPGPFALWKGLPASVLALLPCCAWTGAAPPRLCARAVLDSGCPCVLLCAGGADLRGQAGEGGV